MILTNQNGSTATIIGWQHFGVDVPNDIPPPPPPPPPPTPPAPPGGDGGGAGGTGGTGGSGGSGDDGGGPDGAAGGPGGPSGPYIPPGPFGLPNTLMDLTRNLFQDSELIWLSSPLVLDLDGDGVELTNINSSNVGFDFNNNQIATKTGWVNSDDGLLALDIDQNGRIDNGSELFGDSTMLPGNVAADNGFIALAQYDTNGDQVIDSSDGVFDSLLVWRDLNQDGHSNHGEFSTLSELDIQSINLNYANVSLISSTLSQE